MKQINTNDSFLVRGLTSNLITLSCNNLTNFNFENSNFNAQYITFADNKMNLIFIDQHLISK